MSEATLHKSHSWNWIIGVVLAVVLYMGSDYPVCLSFHSRKGSWLPPSWEEPVFAFYQPADWLLDQPPLDKFAEKWVMLWGRILDVEFNWPLPIPADPAPSAP